MGLDRDEEGDCPIWNILFMAPIIKMIVILN